MEKINYEKILERIIKEYPHELRKIENVINDARKNGQILDIEFSKIITSDIWNSEEKVRLLTFLGHNKYEHYIPYKGKNSGHSDLIIDYRYTIKCDILSGFEALMKIYKDIDKHRDGSKDDSYRNIFHSIIHGCKEESKVVYMKSLLNNL